MVKTIQNTKLRIKAKNDSEKDFFKLIDNPVFGKTIENVRKHRDIKLVTTDKRRNQLVSEPNYHTTKWFSEDLLATEMKKTKVKINKPVYLGLSILDISKILTYIFWYNYIKPKCQNDAKLCCVDTDSLIIHIKAEDFYKDITADVKNRYDTSYYEVNRPLPKGMNKNVNNNTTIIKMRQSIELKDKIYVKRYGFLSFAKNMGHDLSHRFGQKRFDNAKTFTTDAIKTASKRTIRKIAETTSDFISNKIADKITSASKKSPKEFQSRNENKIEIPKEKYISPEKKDNKLLMN